MTLWHGMTTKGKAMQYKSQVPCHGVDRKGQGCGKGAQFTYEDHTYCVDHMKVMIMEAYLRAHPECALTNELVINGQTLKVTQAQIIAIKQILKV
jgi:hypothetical protein